MGKWDPPNYLDLIRDLVNKIICGLKPISETKYFMLLPLSR